MSATSPDLGQFPYLSPEQQGLLRSALESNKRAKSSTNPSHNATAASARSNTSPNNRQLSSPQTDLSNGSKDGPITFGDSLFPDFMDSNTTFDIDFPNMDADLLDYPNLSPEDGTIADFADTGEKRKSPEDDEDDDGDADNNGKRREGEEKVAKKPGRKLITTEPTTKRKAQNRAAQRAFRERKEKHLKDLEQKVTDLEKVSESANQENSVLRAEIDRLQNELSDYKKRLSVSGSTLGTSPTFNDLSSLYTSPTGINGHLSDFQFDFPRFGEAPGTKTTSPPALENSVSGQSSATQRSSSTPSVGYPDRLFPGSPDSQINKDRGVRRFESGIFGGVGEADYSHNFESPQDLTTSMSLTSGRDSLSNQSRSASTANSPGSSTGVNNASSCGTSPEPAPNYNHDGMKTFADLNFGSSALYQDQFTGLAPNQTLYDFSNLDFLSQQNGGQFNPELFGDYRESQAAVVGDGDFSSGFFEDSYNFQDFTGSAANLNFNITNTPNTTMSKDKPIPDTRKITATSSPQPAATKPAASLMEQVARCRDGETGKEPGAPSRELMTTHKLWNELQTCPRFLSGDLDIDSLCSELSAKATCSETGMAVPKDVVEKVLWRLAGVPDPADKATADAVKAAQRDEKHEKSLDRQAMRPFDGCP